MIKTQPTPRKDKRKRTQLALPADLLRSYADYAKEVNQPLSTCIIGFLREAQPTIDELTKNIRKAKKGKGIEQMTFNHAMGASRELAEEMEKLGIKK